ncbi:MAG TPA: serine hydrolase [Gemmatimonadaceae bacterium]|nr:serine hydrolase [Gemmatimonadaceae bacterium]
MPVHRAGDSVTIALPDSQGEFRGTVDPDGRIGGFWVQARGLVSGVRYATPVTLYTPGKGAYFSIGELRPLEEHYRLYMRSTPDSGVTFRVPERNYLGGQGYARYIMQPDGDSIRFVDTTHTFPSFSGHRVGDRITMHWPGLDMPVTLRPATRRETAEYYPRPPGSKYTYRVPKRMPDDWRIGRARDVGIDEAALAAIVQHIGSTDPVSRTAPLIQSLLIARHGRLVLDEYFFGFDADRLHDLRSASKTFTSVMVGAAHVDMNTPLYAALGDPQPDRSRITVGHALTHSTGLACDDNDDDSPGNEDKMYTQTGQLDWYRFILELPVAHDPGTVYAYCSGGINLALGVVARTTNTWLPAFFAKSVAEPLGIHRWAMNLMPTGDGYGGGGLYLRPRDLLKLGVAYLDSGVWHGASYLDDGRWKSQRIVSADWVRQSTAKQIVTGTDTWDGYGWHLNILHAPGRDYHDYEATGNGGQLLIVVPDLDLAVVFTAANYNRYPIWRTFRDSITATQIIPAVH